MRVSLCPPPALRLNFPAGEMASSTSTPVQLRPATTPIANAAIVITMTIVADWPGVLVPAGELCGIPALCHLVCFRRPGATAPARVRMRALSDLISPGPFGRPRGSGRTD